MTKAVCIPAGEGEIFLCQRHKTTHADRAEMCCPHHAVLVEARSISRNKDGDVVDVTQSSGKQTFRAAKELL